MASRVSTNNKRTLLLILTVFVLLLAIGAFAHYLSLQTKLVEAVPWETYTSPQHGFELQHPPHSNIQIQELSGAIPYNKEIRIQNYTDVDLKKNNNRLISGQYFLEISIFDKTIGQKNSEICPGYLLNPQKVNTDPGITAYRGEVSGAGDSATVIYGLCATSKNTDYTFMASEYHDVVARKIIDSIKFTNIYE